MGHSRVTVARLTAPLALLLAAATLLAGCGWRSRDLQPGAWRGVLELPGGELPFEMEVAQEDGGFVLTLVNGEERVSITEVTVQEGRLNAVMPGHENTLTANISGDEMQGEVKLMHAGDEVQTLPFRAEHGKAWRFFEQPLTDNADVSGRWAVTFTDDAGKTTPSVAEFTQSFGIVAGTVLTPTGEHRFLAGEIRDEELYLSRFDGASADLYRAKLNERGELVGEHWSGRTSHRKFVALRNPDATLPAG
jgi:hypothetical protein